MQTIKFLAAASMAIVICAGATLAQASPNLIVNGGFETGDFTGWTVQTGAQGSISITSEAHSGTYAASLDYFSGVGNVGISQSVLIIPGHEYSLDYWSNTLDQGWVENQSFFGVPAQSEQTSTVVGFGFNSPFSYVVDDVSFTDVTVVPEPASLGVLGMGATMLVRRRRRRE